MNVQSDDLVQRLRGWADWDDETGALPADTLTAELRLAADEIERLRRWKAEAMEVLGEWELVWIAAGKPGALGSSKAVAVLAAVLP